MRQRRIKIAEHWYDLRISLLRAFVPTGGGKRKNAAFYLEPGKRVGSLIKRMRKYRFEAAANLNLFLRIGNQGIGDTLLSVSPLWGEGQG